MERTTAKVRTRQARLAYLCAHREADLSYACLSSATLIRTNLTDATLSFTTLIGATLSSAVMGGTHLANLDLRTVKGLETVQHTGPSTIGTDTLERSQADIPEAFLRGAGLSDTFIEYVRSLVTRPIEYYTCFLSYSSRDQDMAERLYADCKDGIKLSRAQLSCP